MTIALPLPSGLIRRLADALPALSAEFSLYFIVSLLALGVDFGLLVALKEFLRLNYLLASAISYLAGGCLQYVLSTRFVFRQHRMHDARFEFVAFLALGLIGLAATQAVMGVAVAVLGLSYVIAKVAATGVSFVVNFAARRALLFSVGRSIS
ncbi:MAG TPA: GtrA family protein [Caulobacteraceae bacterium]|jgi:putative flippase GtrA